MLLNIKYALTMGAAEQLVQCSAFMVVTPQLKQARSTSGESCGLGSYSAVFVMQLNGRHRAPTLKLKNRRCTGIEPRTVE